MLLSFLLLGCAETRTYEVSLRNDSGQPLTVWLTKKGGPFEKGWKAPEELAWQNLSDDEAFSGLTIPVGRTGFTGKVRGSFYPNSAAVLRVYVGASTYNETLAVPADSPNRLEVVLHPGANKYIAVPGDPIVKLERIAD